MNVVDAVILGLVQGIAEFLPISSSGHLVIMKDVLGLGEVDFLFDIFLHIGTLCAVLAVYGDKVVELIETFFKSLKPLFKGQLRWKRAGEARKELEKKDPKHKYTTSPQRKIVLLIFSLLPLFLILPFKSTVEGLFSNTLFVGCALIVTSVFLFICDKLPEGIKRSTNMTVKDAVIVGVVQLIAVFPGISRSGSTITAGIARGLTRNYAAEFSFIMSIPTILAAFLLNLIEMFVSGGINISNIPLYLLGATVSGISGYFAIKFLQYLLKSKKFFWFSIYCLAMGIFAIIRSFV